ncbi:MAG: glycosyltransferase family 2 protein [Bdellovibrionota bacterium]|nr:glycosyltransferase family 2 protein [Bdellovibrionota bacterium]
MAIDFSIISPIMNEEETVIPLCDKIVNVMKSELSNYSFEVILIDDGSTDLSAQKINEANEKYEEVSGIFFRRNFGKSIALNAGFQEAKGEYIITIDADLQDEPNEIPKLFKKLEEGYDLVSGWKEKRQDSLEKRLPSKLFNYAASKITGVSLHDFNCGFKIYRSWCVKNIIITGNLYRYLPALVHEQGGKVTEVSVVHHKRSHGVSKYGVMRYFHGAIDLVTMVFLLKFFQKPLYFFSLLAGPLLVLGGAILTYLLGGHLHYLITSDTSYQLVSRPLLQIAITLLGMGLLIGLNGLLAEFILSVHNRKTMTYHKTK